MRNRVARTRLQVKTKKTTEMKVKLLGWAEDILGDRGEFIRRKAVEMFLSPSVIGLNLLIKGKGKNPWISPLDSVQMMYSEILREFGIFGRRGAKEIFKALKEGSE